MTYDTKVPSRLFEAGLTIEKVALVTGHEDWRTLRRYTKLKPEEPHQLQTAPQPTLEEFVQALTRNEPQESDGFLQSATQLHLLSPASLSRSLETL